MTVLYLALSLLAFLFIIWVLYQLGAGPIMIAILDALLDDSGPRKGGGKGGSGGSWGGGGGFGGGGGGSSW